MKSICIKLVSKNKAQKLFDKIIDKSIDNSIVKNREFKLYYNIIIHYIGDDEKKFLYTMSIIISEFIIENYEKIIIKRCINRNYFYFEEFEREVIFKIAVRILELQELEFNYKSELLSEIIFDFVLNNEKLYLEGFVNFRIKEYVDIIDYLVELSVVNYLKFV